MEQQAEAFYKRFAQMTNRHDVKTLCHKLADEESQHARLIENKLSRWKTLPFDPAELEMIDADGRLQKLFLSPPQKNSTVNEFIEYAIDQEYKMVSFYERFEHEFSNSWKLKRLGELINEEKSHVKKWSELRQN